MDRAELCWAELSLSLSPGPSSQPSQAIPAQLSRRWSAQLVALRHSLTLTSAASRVVCCIDGHRRRVAGAADPSTALAGLTLHLRLPSATPTSLRTALVGPAWSTEGALASTMPRAVEKSASSPSPSSSPSSSAAASAESYDVGDWVLVEQQGMWWEARVLAVRSQQEAEDGKCLKVHYMGWNSKWNMWVGAGYTRRLTADTRRRADEDNRRARQAKVAAKRSRSAAAAAAGGARGGRRRRRAAEEGAQPEAGQCRCRCRCQWQWQWQWVGVGVGVGPISSHPTLCLTPFMSLCLCLCVVLSIAPAAHRSPSKHARAPPAPLPAPSLTLAILCVCAARSACAACLLLCGVAVQRDGAARRGRQWMSSVNL